MTVSLAAVFIPVLFMGGIVGRLLHEFAVTIGVAILISGFVSISLTPMLCSRFLQAAACAAARLALQRVSKRDVRRRGCGCTTGRCASRCASSAVMIAVSIALLVGTVYLFMIVPKGFLPSEDQGRFMVNTEAAQGISYEDMSRHQMQRGRIAREGPERRQHQRHGWRDRQQRRHDEHRPHLGRVEAAHGPRSCRSTS